MQYSDSRFVGLCLGRRRHIREIELKNDNLFPLPDKYADAFQSQDVLEHIQTEKVVIVLNEYIGFLNLKDFAEFHYLIIIHPFLKKDQYMILKVKSFVI